MVPDECLMTSDTIYHGLAWLAVWSTPIARHNDAIAAVYVGARAHVVCIVLVNATEMENAKRERERTVDDFI